MDKKKIIIPYVIATAMILGILGYTFAYFSATVQENNKTETVIKTDKLTLVFTGTNEITTGDNMIPGDSFTKTFTVENTSDVDTKYNIYMEKVTNEFNEDLVYVLSDEDGVVVEETPLPVTNESKSYLISDIEIASKELKTYTIKIEYKYLDTPQDDYQGATFRGTVGVDANKIGNDVVNPEGSSRIGCALTTDENLNGTADFGDMITCGESEGFYVYSNDGSTIKMLAEYNLKVGTIDNSRYPVNEETNLQSKEALGVKEGFTSYATIIYSSDTIKGTNYSDYEGSIVQDYVENYKIKLKGFGANIEEVTLMTKEELEEIAGTQLNAGLVTSLVPEWIYSTSYWFKTPYNTESVWFMNTVGNFAASLATISYSAGVRPVVYISTNEL